MTGHFISQAHTNAPFSTLTALEMIDSHEESAGGESYFFHRRVFVKSSLHVRIWLEEQTS